MTHGLLSLSSTTETTSRTIALPHHITDLPSELWLYTEDLVVHAFRIPIAWGKARLAGLDNIFPQLLCKAHPA